MKWTTAFAALLLAVPAISADWEKKPGLYAVFDTSKGKIVCVLFEKKAPFTVANFVELATGQKSARDPRDGKVKRWPYYNGTKFHRVIPGFMIQGGDPTASGTGGPGYMFNDEIHGSLTFNRPGLLAMANSGQVSRGPQRFGTNGSQFFITDRPRGQFSTPPAWLNGKHAIFGEVVEGLDVVTAIADLNVQPGRGDPKNAAVIKTLEIKRVGGDQKK